MNISLLFTDVAEIIGDVTVDETELEAGTPAQLPAAIVVGSTGGKPIYLTGTLTTIKPTPSGLAVPTGFNLGVIFTDLVTIYGDVTVDEAELATGATVAIPAVLEVGSIGGKPIYLDASLTTTKPAVVPV